MTYYSSTHPAISHDVSTGMDPGAAQDYLKNAFDTFHPPKKPI